MNQILLPKLNERKLTKHASVDKLLITKYAQNSININSSRKDDFLQKKLNLINKEKRYKPLIKPINFTLLNDVQKVQNKLCMMDSIREELEINNSDLQYDFGLKLDKIYRVKY